MKSLGESGVGAVEYYSRRNLIAFFVAWKLLLLLVACASPGPGYDTSTQILLDQQRSINETWVARAVDRVVLRLTRWDGIYFATLAERGHVYEQDWAFSFALARWTHGTSEVLFSKLPISPVAKQALSGIIISHVSHFSAVVVLYQIAIGLIPVAARSKKRIAFAAASLHVLSPASLFLSSPYGESSFAFLNFTAIWSYVLARRLRLSHTAASATFETYHTIASGVFFAAATAVRSNGLLSGTLYAWDAAEALLQPQKLLQNPQELRRLAATCIAGMLVGVGFSLPQLRAYMEYCSEAKTRPWCSRTPPSIYGWVQDHYWGVGFLRYWTLSNLPLFLIAGPVLVLLLVTGYVCFWNPERIVSSIAITHASKDPQDVVNEKAEKEVIKQALQRLAVPQLMLAVMAATSFHVQIINRISSGYPLWYIVLAHAMHSKPSMGMQQVTETTKDSKMINGKARLQQKSKEEVDNSGWPASVLRGQRLQFAVRGMVLYAIVQGGLYASFLPPA